MADSWILIGFAIVNAVMFVVNLREHTRLNHRRKSLELAAKSLTRIAADMGIGDPETCPCSDCIAQRAAKREEAAHRK